MSVQPSQPSGRSSGGEEGQSAGSDGRRFSTLIGSLAATPADRQVTAVRPTFTARASEPPVVTKLPSADPPEVAQVPDNPNKPDNSDQEATRALRRHGAAAADEPLLDDVAGLRDRWQRAQAGFVDDPQQAVGDAADLIEQTAQALVGALRQRQRTLRVMWERGPAGDSVSEDDEPAARASDTEHLRLMMQRYRALFNQLCRP